MCRAFASSVVVLVVVAVAGMAGGDEEQLAGGLRLQLDRDTPRQLLEAWVGLWRTYDLDLVSELFLRDDALTYFSSETEGLISGFERVVDHHRGFGFVSGGVAREQVIWVRDVRIDEFGGTALLAAIWYFGDPDEPEDAQRGPMTVLAVRTSDGYRIAHMHFATYVE